MGKMLLVSLFLIPIFLSGCSSAYDDSSGPLNESNSNFTDVSENNSDKEEDDFGSSNLIPEETWNCTIDCSGHQAGYDWAAENGITEPEDCGGNSQSFIEGCESFGQEYQDEGY